MKAGWAWLLVLALLAGCRGDGGGGAEVYPVTIRLHPAEASLTLKSQADGLTALAEMRGPQVSLRLPVGSYEYEVMAQEHQAFAGSFEIPKNKNLEVWLTPQRP